ncbi:hypothetical protein [Streptomyces catenulae]|uniref:Lipoprotein n=1 Tax=Streptomyces catenulae TaxID=66875 RepID=A0ABV2Z4H1_9ACTN|nr:hypothetical protein [Streptomyces catenulae]
MSALVVLSVMVAATTTGCVTLPSRPVPTGHHPTPPAPTGRPGPAAPLPPQGRIGPVTPQPAPRRPDGGRATPPPGRFPHHYGGSHGGAGGGTRPLPPPSSHREHAPAPPAPSRVPRLGDGLSAGAELCALGRKYGRWQGDGAALRICRQTYG